MKPETGQIIGVVIIAIYLIAIVVAVTTFIGVLF